LTILSQVKELAVGRPSGCGCPAPPFGENLRTISFAYSVSDLHEKAIKTRLPPTGAENIFAVQPEISLSALNDPHCAYHYTLTNMHLLHRDPQIVRTRKQRDLKDPTFNGRKNTHLQATLL
jgi:hypothetical protein